MSFLKSFIKGLFNFNQSIFDQPPVSIEIAVGLDWLITQAHQLVGGQNTVWLSPNEFGRLKHAARTGTLSKRQTFFNDISRRTFKPIHQDELIKAISPIEEGRLTSILKDGHILTPVCHPENHELLGYILSLSISKSDERSALKKMSHFSSFSARYVSYCMQYFEATSMSLKDDLTSLYNQKYMCMVVDSEIHRSVREDKKFSVLFIDIDHFKKVNDSLGHWVGSHLLAELGGLLGASIRKSDYAFRYGGDEFVVVLPSTDGEGAKVAAERIRQKVEKNPFCIDGQEIGITLSIGISTYPDHAKSRQDIIKLADEAMYNGKNKSRNIVLMAS